MKIDQDITIRSISSKKETETLKAGSRVVTSPVIPCINCNYCDNKKYNLCTNLTEIGSSIDGGFVENVRIPKNILYIGGIVPIPDCTYSIILIRIQFNDNKEYKESTTKNTK